MHSPWIRRPAPHLLGFVLVLAGGCRGDAVAEGALPPAAVPPDVAQPDTPPQVAAVAPAAGEAVALPAGRTRKELGEAAVVVVEQADAVGAARMRVIAAREAIEGTLSSDDLLGGYPIEAPLVPLDPAARAELLRRLLDDASYDFETARRCGNDYLVGVRFQRGQERVEFALGVPCMQAFWSSRADGEVQRTGAIMLDDAAGAVLRLAGDAGVRGAVK